jgi:chemotaxis protein methyltransferase CheR
LNRVSQDPAYARLKEFLIATTGLAFYADRDELLTALIAERLSFLGLRGCSSYSAFLANGEASSGEMDVLIARLTIGETYFFRDQEQFAAIRDIIVPDLLARKRSSRQLLIWSAGCATGAEPYSLAILLARELGDQIEGWSISIHATDLNRSFLALAAEGKFRAAALRSTSDQMKRECFTKEGLTWTIQPRYKKWISFHQINLVESEFSTAFRGGADFDLILCRNVMIYFSREVNRRLIGQFHRALGNGGWLVVGASECNLDCLNVFRTEDATGTRLFQKLAPESRPLEANRPPRPVAAPRPLTEPQAEASSRPDPIPSGPAPPVPAELEGLRQLADRGDWQAAAEYGKRLLVQNGLNAEVYFYHALIFEKLGIVDEPARSLRQAIYLDRNFALAHYHLGLALKRDGQERAAERCFGNVLKILDGLPDLTIVTAGPGITVTGLKELARMHLVGANGTGVGSV